MPDRSPDDLILQLTEELIEVFHKLTGLSPLLLLFPLGLLSMPIAVLGIVLLAAGGTEWMLPLIVPAFFFFGLTVNDNRSRLKDAFLPYDLKMFRKYTAEATRERYDSEKLRYCHLLYLVFVPFMIHNIAGENALSIVGYLVMIVFVFSTIWHNYAIAAALPLPNDGDALRTPQPSAA